MKLKVKVVVEPSNADPSILVGLALIRVNEDAVALASSYQKKIFECVNGYKCVYLAPDMFKSLEERMKFYAKYHQ
ncbi:hypothetical protein EVAR_36807_1 [Eumeta japonica]|uniref:Uncharacterized protein n=1 Tax=Eumeta variegata TaxID=151549 RepID=A0A4C1WYS0_EUMVA|nr:hypothetical protein EVAR_36807_1 [Eumeta japonica]